MSLASSLNTKPAIPHLVIEARAGTGKTTTLVEGLKVLRGQTPSIEPSPQQQAVWDALRRSPSNSTACFVAFNKSIATELQRRVPTGVDAMTLHSLGFKAVQKSFGRIPVDSYRVQNIVSEILQQDIREIRRYNGEMLRAVESLVGLCKSNLIDLSDSDNRLDDLASYYEVDLNGSRSKIFDLVPQILEKCQQPDVDRCIDFNDMIWLPVVLKLPVSKYDLLLVDEAQDLNRCQQTLALSAGRRLVFCGDPKQAIYGFAGADCKSMSRLTADLQAEVLPLNVTRRCGKVVVKEANKIVPDFAAFETNPEGLVSRAKYKSETSDPTYHSSVQDGDMVLCRCNAPLVSQCFKFIKAGRKATIQGRDIGQGLISTIRKFRVDTVPDLIHKLSDWYHQEIEKENRKRNPSESRLISIQDKRDCIEALTEGSTTVNEVVAKIESLFSDEAGDGIKFSSIHRAKGLEARRVFLLLPKEAPCPHPMAKSMWAREQEMNLLYVAITRAIDELVYVS